MAIIRAIDSRIFAVLPWIVKDDNARRPPKCYRFGENLKRSNVVNVNVVRLIVFAILVA